MSSDSKSQNNIPSKFVSKWRGERPTDAELEETSMCWCEQLGKTPVGCDECWGCEDEKPIKCEHCGKIDVVDGPCDKDCPYYVDPNEFE